MTHPAPILARDVTAAKLLDMSTAEFRAMVARGVLPKPVNLSGLERWRVADLTAILDGSAGEFET